jgi:hypothetical protein
MLIVSIRWVARLASAANTRRSYMSNAASDLARRREGGVGGVRESQTK